MCIRCSKEQDTDVGQIELPRVMSGAGNVCTAERAFLVTVNFFLFSSCSAPTQPKTEKST